MQTILYMIAQRIALGLLVLFVVSLIIFLSVEMLPGDIAQALLGQSATADNVAAMRAEMGLDQPPLKRYLSWLGNIVQGDFGRSLATKREISELIKTRVFNTFFLAGLATIVAVPLSLFLGILAALYRNSIYDRLVNMFTLSSISFPEFFVAYILLIVFSVNLGWFPSLSNIDPSTPLGDRLYKLVLPATTLTLVVVAHMMRMTRASLINLLSSPYIEMANLKGMSKFRVILFHALPNAWAPIVNIIAVNLAYLIVGVVVVESVFVYPGLGQLIVDSVSKRDLPVVQACCMIFAATYIVLNLIADVVSILTNPRLLHPR